MRHAAEGDAVAAAAAVERVAAGHPGCGEIHAGGGHHVRLELGYRVLVVGVQLASETEERRRLQNNGKRCSGIALRRPDFVEADAGRAPERQDRDARPEQRAVRVRLDAAAGAVPAAGGGAALCEGQVRTGLLERVARAAAAGGE